MTGDTVAPVAGYAVTSYGLIMALACVGFFLATHALVKYVLKRDPGDMARVFVVIIPSGLLGARAVYCAANPDIWQGLGNALCVWRGGLSLVGAILFAAVALRLYMGSGRAFSQACDCLTPGAMLFISVIRAAEGSTGEGVGKCVDTEFLRAGPLVMLDEYGEIRHAVYRWEALAALLLCAFAVWLTIKKPRRSRVSRLTWMLFCAVQVLFESLRDDDYLKWEYVRISQVAYFLALLVFAGIFIAGAYKSLGRLEGSGVPFASKLGWASLLIQATLGAAVTVIQEFRVDTDVNLELNYLIMALGLIATSACALRCDALIELSRKKSVGRRIKNAV